MLAHAQGLGVNIVTFNRIEDEHGEQPSLQGELIYLAVLSFGVTSTHKLNMPHANECRS